jgi:AcrR family transcriptional regulator/DNA-binding MarR family transcriptional regulator
MSPQRRASGNGKRTRARQAYDSAVRAQLNDLQRARIVGAMVSEACERGAGSVTVAHVVARSGVSRRTFYELFTDRDDCFLAAFEQVLTVASGRVLDAYVAQARLSWRERIRAGLVALLAFLDEEPAIGCVIVSESSSGGPRVLARREEIRRKLIAAIDEGRGEAKNGTAIPALMAEGVCGGVLAVIQARLSERAGASSSRTQGAWRAVHASDRGRRDAPPMLALTNELMSMIVLPYLGASAAKRELDRSVVAPPSTPTNGTLLADPFKASGARLTYRTIRVLVAVSENAGGSNRLIGETAGMSDQGQVSKLLNRLKRIGLIENTGEGAGKGMPNAWLLTEKGKRIAEAMREQTGEETS